MLDHVALGVSDYDRSRAFYEAALAPLGIGRLTDPAGEKAGFGAQGGAFFWIDSRPPVRGVHVAFTAEDRATVDRFHAAGLAAGGVDNGAPGIRANYAPDYYAAFVLDPDGNNIEAVCHKPG